MRDSVSDYYEVIIKVFKQGLSGNCLKIYR